MIVILERDPGLARLLEECIHDWFSSVEVLSFDDEQEAWRVVSQQAPSLLILDSLAPGVTEGEILARLAWSQATFPILLTSEFFEEHAHVFSGRGLKLAFLPKPFQIRELWAALNELVGRSDYPEMQALAKPPLAVYPLP